MKTRLLVTSGNGPAECRMAVAHVVRRLTEEASAAGIDADTVAPSDKHGPSSAVVTLHGEAATALAARWLGTIQWSAKSPVRTKHKRQNWFVGVVPFEQPARADTLDPADVRFETFRAGGPGGQHQNTTDSAVRATHEPSGLTAIARDQRSQHRNKAMALERLRDQLAAHAELSLAASRKEANRAHHAVERGNPVRRFKGERFVEV